MKMFTFLVALLFAATNLHAQCTAYFQSTVSGNTASFYATNSGGGMINNNTYVWSFGDGTSGTGANVSHTYSTTTAATYTVCVTMTEAATGCTATYCNTIAINGGSGTPCNVNATFTYSQNTGGVSFTSSISGFSPNVTYSWSFTPGTVGSTLANPTVQLANGTYNVCLTVSDGTCSDTYCATVTVGNTTNPCLGFTGSFTYTVSGGVVSFVGNGGNSSGSGGSYNYVWNFGDGTSGTGMNITHTYTNTTTADSAWVCMTVSDPINNCTYTYCNWVVFGGSTSNPCASLTANFQYYTSPGGATHFWAGNSGGVFGGNGLIYNWSFGNGATAYGPHVTHLFSGTPVLVTPNGSFYQACLTVTNPTNGCTATHCVYIALPSLTNANTGGPTTSSGVFFNTTTPKPVEDNNLPFETETNLTIFPNPASDILNISVQSESINGSLTIINANGQTIYQENITFKGDTQMTVPVQDLPTGIYFVQLLSNDFQKVVKFIKQ